MNAAMQLARRHRLRWWEFGSASLHKFTFQSFSATTAFWAGSINRSSNCPGSITSQNEGSILPWPCLPHRFPWVAGRERPVARAPSFLTIPAQARRPCYGRGDVLRVCLRIASITDSTVTGLAKQGKSQMIPSFSSTWCLRTAAVRKMIGVWRKAGSALI